MNTLPAVYNEFWFDGISEFNETLITQKCHVYASDLLRADSPEMLLSIDGSVQHAMDIFSALHQKIDSHFFKVYRGDDEYIFKDWKLSELACLYVLMDCDPKDLSYIAHQQNTLIDQLLRHVIDINQKLPA